MKFEKDFDFESANAQFNKEEIDREFQSKLKLKGTVCLSRRQRGARPQSILTWQKRDYSHSLFTQMRSRRKQ